MTSSSEPTDTIVELLGRRKPESSICPSDVARHIAGDGGPKGAEPWRDLMDPVRDAAAGLAQEGTVVITQGDETVDITTAKGPIRIRRGPNWE